MLGLRIKSFRKKKGWSQEQLASAASLKQVLISRIERGTRKLDVSELQSIASALGVKVSDLLDETRARAVGE